MRTKSFYPEEDQHNNPTEDEMPVPKALEEEILIADEPIKK